ncbi:MAG: hypothetical protein IT338_11070, partial [Thermomicrobiales bacterium]|nr:hypothetical protein [Thermomicrobiales bacterium]
MDANRFDHLVQSLVLSASRRRLLALLAPLPLLGGLLPLVDEETAEAKKRPKHRVRRPPHCQGRHTSRCRSKRTRKKRCKAKSKAKTCAGKCGPIRNKCRKTVDCGSCACDPPCGECLICDDRTGQCVPDPEQQGDACGETGQICQADGTCACDAKSCAACETCQADGRCSAPCQGRGCCDRAGVCQPGTTDAACGTRGGACASCTGFNHCQGGVCRCVPTTCQAEGKACGTIGDGCGSRLDCGTCSGTTPICSRANRCVACSAATPCPAGFLCQADGSCRACDITCPATDHTCAGSELQAKLANGGTIVVCPGRYTGAFTIPGNVTVTVIGAGAGDDPASNTILDADGSGTTLTINNNAPVDLQRLRVTGGKSIGAAGISNGGRLTMTGCTLAGNNGQTGVGGGLYNFPPGSATLTNCTITQNSAASAGGLYQNSHHGAITLIGCVISRNTATQGVGGGIQVNDGVVNLDAGTSVTENKAAMSGGGIFKNIISGTVNLNGATVSGNLPDNCV